jgi:hypothetical protein
MRNSPKATATLKDRSDSTTVEPLYILFNSSKSSVIGGPEHSPEGTIPCDSKVHTVSATFGR